MRQEPFVYALFADEASAERAALYLQNDSINEVDISVLLVSSEEAVSTGGKNAAIGGPQGTLRRLLTSNRSIIIPERWGKESQIMLLQISVAGHLLLFKLSYFVFGYFLISLRG